MCPIRIGSTGRNTIADVLKFTPLPRITGSLWSVRPRLRFVRWRWNGNPSQGDHAGHLAYGPATPEGAFIDGMRPLFRAIATNYPDRLIGIQTVVRAPLTRVCKCPFNGVIMKVDEVVGHSLLAVSAETRNRFE